jgi:hypothetical protein
MIYNNKLPSVYTYDLERTVFGRVLPPNKAVLGGLIFDIYESLPDTADPNALNKIKWHIYSGLQKGCTGLIFFGWQKYARPEGGISIAAWNNVRTIVNEMVNILHLNDRVFIYTNSGQVNHTVSGSYSGNVSYAVYKIAGWNDYYLLVTNNPNGSLFANEPDNTVTISGDPSVINWRKCSIKEEFTGQNIQLQPDLSIRYTMPCYATALFHVKVTEAPFYFYLFQNYPNPFNNTTKIIFELSESSFITINIYDVNGREVKKLLSGNFNAGRYEVEFDGSALASSVYFYELRANGSSRFRKMVLVK